MRVDTSKPDYYKKNKIWKNISLKDWNDWHWQLKNSVKSVSQLGKTIPLTNQEREDISKALKVSRFRVTPYYLSLIDKDNPECPIRMSAIPAINELHYAKTDIYDPLGEDKDSPVPRLVHRYPDRVLFLASEVCSMYCRFCTRRRMVLDKTAEQLSSEHKKALAYITEHKEIRDVIVSGGDALMLDLKQLERIVKSLKAIKHVEIVRVASRVPCVLPQRITKEVVDMLKKYAPIYFMTHFNHPYEVTKEARRACEMIVDAGIPIMNQSVLLRKINSSPYVMKKLVHELLKMRVLPYYIYQCDLAEGIDHFRTPVGNGLKIMEHLRGHTSGIALPTLVVDAPAGGGKVPIMPNYLLTQTEQHIVIRNYRGAMSSYAAPAERDCFCSTEAEIKSRIIGESKKGKAYIGLVEGTRIKLEPKV